MFDYCNMADPPVRLLVLLLCPTLYPEILGSIPWPTPELNPSEIGTANGI